MDSSTDTAIRMGLWGLAGAASFGGVWAIMKWQWGLLRGDAAVGGVLYWGVFGADAASFFLEPRGVWPVGVAGAAYIGAAVGALYFAGRGRRRGVWFFVGATIARFAVGYILLEGYGVLVE